MDNKYRPDSQNCLVYSFGVGHDFSFDGSIQVSILILKINEPTKEFIF